MFFSLSECPGFVATGFPWNLTGSLFAVDLAHAGCKYYWRVRFMYYCCGVCFCASFWALGRRRVSIFAITLPFVLAAAGIRGRGARSCNSVKTEQLFALCSQQFRRLKNGTAQSAKPLDQLIGLSRRMGYTEISDLA